MYQWPAWSPDGKLLAAMNVAWCEVGMKVSSVEIIDALNGGSVDRHGPYDFWQADGTLQGPRRLSTPNNISWSRDGEMLLVSWDKAVVINAKSGKPRVISSRPVLAEWAPTSDAVYYFEIETGEGISGTGHWARSTSGISKPTNRSFCWARTRYQIWDWRRSGGRYPV